MKKYNLNQLRILREYFDDENICDFLTIVNPHCSCSQLEILAKAYRMGIDISDLVNCNVSSDCLVLLCDSKMKGIDIKGLGNEFLDVDLLKQIILIKRKNISVDMAFVEDLSLNECKNLVDDYRLFDVSIFNKYREISQMNRKMIETELHYVINTKKSK